jgi:hypothetical protein
MSVETAMVQRRIDGHVESNKDVEYGPAIFCSLPGQDG